MGGQGGERVERFRRWCQRLRAYWRSRHQRCDYCWRRKFWNDAWHSYRGTDKVWHSTCMSYRHWRTKADERLAILDLVTEVWSVTADDVRTIAEGRASTGANHRTNAEANAWNRAWRVFYDLDHYRKDSGQIGSSPTPPGGDR